MKKKVAKVVKQIPYLDYMCQIGETVQWKDLSNKVYVGKLVTMDEDFLASVKLKDGTIVQYQC